MLHIRSIRIACVGALMLSLATVVAARAGDPVSEKFDQFCADWMQKLAVRQHDNEQNIQWVRGSGGVTGEYVGYSTDHTCQLKPLTDPKAVPIAKIIYQEIRYQKHGSSQTAAADAPPEALELTEVTEIFQYQKGKWQY